MKRNKIKIITYFAVWIIFAAVGLCSWLRPSTSNVERRTLATFPELSFDGIWDGTFFSEIDTWYADTYPLREYMISLSQSLQSIYGIQTETIVGDALNAEEIPEGEVDLEALVAAAEEEEEVLEEVIVEEEAAEVAAETSEEIEVEEAEEETEEELYIPDVADQTLAGFGGSVYANSEAAYGIYGFSSSASARYCLALNSLAESLEGIATVYDLIAPVSGCIMLSESTQNAIGCSDASEAINFMFTNMSESIVTVNCVNNLLAHRDEYIYFKTDHHWTALGAYYAYQQFCAMAGLSANSIESYETMTFDGFLGTFYSTVSASYTLEPDTVIAYIPNGTNKCHTFLRSGSSYKEIDWNVVYNVYNYNKYSLYSCFAVGDEPYTYAHNETITDGSSILVVKDSYGNALIPFLIDHYEYVYWIDFRYYSKYASWAGYESDSISWLVKENGIENVLVINNLCSTGSSTLLSSMEAIFK